MGRVFQTLSEGIAKFAYAAILPSSLSIGVMAFLLVPDLYGKSGEFDALMDRFPDDPLLQILTFGLVAVGLSTVLSLTISLPTYRLLEGYTLPGPLARRLRTRQIQRFIGLERIATRSDLPPQVRIEAEAALTQYPRSVRDILPTTLGNRLRAGELHSRYFYKLSILDFWYELVTSTSDEMRRYVDDTRTAMDFYMNVILNLVLLLIAAVTTVIVSGSTVAVIVAIVAFLLIPASYFGAIASADDYRLALQALGNTSRHELARSFGYWLPENLKEERKFWNILRWAIVKDPDHLMELDQQRLLAEKHYSPES